MQDDGDRAGRWIFVGCCLGAAIFLVANGLACRPADCPTFWLGSSGFFPFLVSLGTLIAVSAAGFLAWRSYKANREIGAATRFQKAVELIGSDDSSTSIGGIWSALDVAKQYPERYLAPTFKCLQAFIKDGSVEVRDRAFSDYTIWRGNWPGTQSAQVQAFIACTHIPSADRWPDALDHDGSTELVGGYLSRVSFSGLNLRKLNLRDFGLIDVTFVRCDFRECEVSGRLFGNVTFRECDLRNAEFDVADPGGKPPGQWAVFLMAPESQIEGATLGGLPLDWALTK